MAETTEERQARLRAAREDYARSLRDKPYDDMSFGAAFNAAKAEGKSTFSWRDKTYSTETREERTQKAYSDTSRRQDVAPKAAPSAAPAARPRASLSDIPGLIARGMSEGADRVPAGRGLGAAFTAAGAARGAGAAVEGALARRQAANAAAETENLSSRIAPLLATSRNRETGQFRPSEASLSRARQQARDEDLIPDFKKGGKVKAYAKGGSVKGAGCEQRGLRKCKVY